MKLHEISKSKIAWNSPSTKQWFKDHVILSVDQSHMNFKKFDGDEVYDLLVKAYNSKNNDKFSYWKIFFNFKDKAITKCPVPDDVWLNILEEHGNGIRYENCIIDDAKLLCNLNIDFLQIEFKRAKIKSLKLEPSSKIQQLNFSNDIKIECGLLSLLKAPKLKFIVCDNGSKEDQFVALRIVKKYVYEDDRDILECQNELIDANLDEFAIL